MSAIICEHDPQFRAAGAAGFSAEVALCSSDSQHQVVRASESSLPEQSGRLKSEKTGFEEHCEPEARRGGCSRNVLYSASGNHRSLRENIQKLGDQCAQDSADFGIESDGLQARLVIDDSRTEAS